MIVMLDTPQDLHLCAKELGCEVEQFFSPTTMRNPQQPDKRFAIDNGAYAKFETAKFKSILAKHEERRHLCRFVTAPDVIGSAIRTLECFHYWRPRLKDWPIAFVCQDGQESLPIPWEDIAAVFIGGSTEWKLSKHAAVIVKAANILGTWCHVGRINTPGRLEYFEGLGADSCDGTGMAQYSHMRLKILNARTHPELQLDANAEQH